MQILDIERKGNYIDCDEAENLAKTISNCRILSSTWDEAISSTFHFQITVHGRDELQSMEKRKQTYKE